MGVQIENVIFLLKIEFFVVFKDKMDLHKCGSWYGLS